MIGGPDGGAGHGAARHGPPIATSPLVARSRQLAALLAAATRPPSLVVLTGAAGVGKTRLMREVGALLAGDVPVASGSGQQIRSAVPLGPIVEALGGLAEHLGGRELPSATRVLRDVVPELGPILPRPATGSGGSGTQRRQLFEAVAALLRTAGPVALLLDDLHWADPLTLELVDSLALHPPPELAIVLGCRSSQVPASVAALPHRAVGVDVARMHLDPLDSQASGALAAGVLGVHGVSPAFAGFLHHRSGGNPAAIHETIHLLIEQGDLAFRDGQWARRQTDQMIVPTDYGATVLRRGDRLPAPARDLLDLIAVLRRPTSGQVLARAGDLLRIQLEPALRELSASGLVAVDGSEVRPVHDLAAAALYDALPADRRQKVHAAVATALEETGTDPGVLMHHLRQAGDERWVDAGERAAAEAARNRDHDTAFDYLRQLWTTGALDPADRSRIAAALAQSFSYAVAADRPLFDQVRAEILNAPSGGTFERAVAALRLASAAQNLFLDRGVRQELVDLVRHDPLAPEALRHQAAVRAALIPGYLAPHCQAEILAAATEAIDRAAPDEAGIDLLAVEVTTAAIELGLPGAPVPPHITLAPSLRLIAHSVHGMTALVSGDLTQAARYFEQARALERQGNPAPAGLADAESVEACRFDYAQGSWQRLEKNLRTVTGPHPLMPVYRWVADSLQSALDIHRVGPTRSTVSVLGSSAGSLLDADAADLMHVAVAVLLRLADTEVDGIDIAALSDEIVGRVAVLDPTPALFSLLPCVVERLVLTGRRQEADELVGRYRAMATGRVVPLAEPALTRSCAHLSARTDPDAAAAGLRAAAADYRSRGWTVEAVIADSEAAVVAAAARLDSAGELIRAAIDGFDDLGAIWEADRLRRRARTVGLTVPSRHRRGPKGYGDQLSPRELQVAVLVERGLGNRQIAERLMVSVHTVNKQVAAILRKLGVAGRADIGVVLARRASG